MKRLFILLIIIWSAQVNAYDELHLKRFKALNKCPGCDLSGANLSGFHDYSGGILEGANLKDAVFAGAKLRYVNFRGANLHGADLSRADLEGASFTQANLTSVNLSRAIVCKVCLDIDNDPTKSTSIFGRSKASFIGANLSGANLIGFKARSSDFTGADLTNTNLEEGDFSMAIFCNTKTPWGIENVGCTDN